jgi:hypothetical protein
MGRERIHQAEAVCKCCFAQQYWPYTSLYRYSADEPCGYDYTPQDGSECAGGATKLYVCGTCGMFWDASYLTGVSKYN